MGNHDERGDDVAVSELSRTDQRHLATFETKLQLIRDRTASVAYGRTNGVHLFGKGGTGKTYTVEQELRRLQVPYKLFNSRMTGRGLYDALEEFPDSIHVLEDMEQMFRDTGARGVLRSALWATPDPDRQGPSERLVTWTTCNMVHQFVFTGGIIMIGNKSFPDIPELQAVRTRIANYHLLVSENEMIAVMRHISLQGYRAGRDIMDSGECMAVCEFVVDQTLGLNRSLDMRLLVNSFQDYLQWRECQSGCCWQDLVSSRVKERPTALREVVPIGKREIQKQRELEIAAQIAASTADRAERLRLWDERVGKSEATLYRRLDELAESRI